MAETKPRILLVDDDPSMLKMYGKRFELAGYEVLTAGDGEEAVAVTRQQRPNLVILDIELPKLSGYEVCARLKQDPSTTAIPIIMFTAKGTPHELPATVAAGPDVYLSKSCESRALLEQIQHLVPGTS